MKAPLRPRVLRPRVLRPRALRFQSLESRNLLAGNVLLDVRNGQLFVTGDDLDNGLTIERVFDAATGATSLLCTPDATTSVNGQPVGQAVTVADFNRDGVVDLRAGSDALTLIGNNFGDAFPNTALRCSTGSGNDTIEIESWSWGASLAISSSGGSDTISLSNVRVGGAVTLSSSLQRSSLTMTDCVVTQPNARLSAITLSNMDADLERCVVQGALRATGTLVDGNAAPILATYKLQDCIVSSYSLSHRGGGTDFSSTRSSFFDISLDLDVGAAVDSPSSVVLSESDLTRSLSLRSRGSTSLSVESCAMLDAYVKIDSIFRRDSDVWSFVDSEFRRLSAEGRGEVDVSVERCAAVDMFLKLDGIKGEVHRSSVSILQCDTTHLSVRSTVATDLDLSRSSFFDVVVDISSLNGLPPGEPYLKVKMTDILVSSFCSVSTRVGGVDAEISNSQFELASWSFGASNTGAHAGGGGGGAGKVSMSDLHFTRSASLSLTGLYDVSVSSLRAVDLFLKLDRATASQAVSTTDCDDVDVTGRFSLQSRGAVDVSLESCSAFDAFLKIEGIKGESHSASLYVADTLNNRLQLSSLVTCDVTLERSSFFDIVVDITQSPASPNGGQLPQLMQIKMSDLLVSSFCSVTTRGGQVDADIGDSEFQGSCSFSFGATQTGSFGTGGGGGAGKVNVHDISVTKSASLSWYGLYDVVVSRSVLKDFFLKGDRPTEAQFSSVAIADLDCDGRFSLESNGALDVTLESCAAADMFLKLGGIKGELHRSSVSVVDSSASSRLSLTSLVTCDVSLERSSFLDVAVDLTRSPSPPGSAYLQIKMSEVLVSGFCTVSTKGSLVEAEISSSDFGNNVNWSFGGTNLATAGAGGGGGAGKVSMNDLSFARSSSLSVSGLYDVAVSSVSAVDFFVKLDRPLDAQRYSKVEWYDLRASGRCSLESRGAVDVSLASCSAVDMFLKLDGIKGELHRSSVSIVESSASSRLSLTSLVTCDVSLARCSFFDVTVDITRSASPPGASYLQFKMSDLLVSGFCAVSTSGSPVDAEISSSTFDGACSFSFGASNPATFSSGAGGGAGKVSMSDLSFGRSVSVSAHGLYDVSVSSLAAVDFFLKLDRAPDAQRYAKVEFHDLRASGRCSVDSRGAVDLSATSCSAADMFIKFDGIKGELHSSSVSIEDSSVSSRLTLTSLVTCDVSLARSSFFDVAVSVTRSASPAGAAYMKVTFSDLLVSGFCTVSSTGGTEAEVSSSIFEKSLSFSWGLSQTGTFSAGGGGGAGKVSMSDLSVTGALSVSSRGQTEVTALACTAGDIYLKVDRVSRFDDNSVVDLEACSATGRLSIEGRGGTDVSVDGGTFASIFMKFDGIKGELHRQSVSVDGVASSSLSCVSTEVLDFSLASSSFFDVVCDFSLPSTSSPGAASALSSSLSHLRVDGSLTLSSRGASHDITLSQCVCGDAFVSTDCPSGRSSSVAIEDSGFTGGLSVLTRGESHVTVDSCPASDMFLKFDRLATGQPGSSSLAMSACPVAGSLSVQGTGSMDVALDACRATDIFLKLDAMRGERRTSSVSLNSSTSSGRTSISSTCPLDLTVVGGSAADMFVKIDRIAGAAVDGSRVVIQDQDCDGLFSLSSSSGSDVVVLGDLVVRGRSTISLGAGDDRLDISSSSFDLQLFDGGQGFDRLSVVDSFFASQLLHTNFEQVLLPPGGGVP